MYNIGHINLTIEIFGILMSATLLFFLLIGTDKDSRLSRLFIRIVACNIAALSTDAIAWSHDGDPSEYAIVITRAAKFTTYILQFMLIPLLTDYVTALIGSDLVNGGKIRKMMYTLFAAASATVIISQFTGLYYIFDEFNRYRTQDFFWLSQMFGAVMLAMVTFLIIRYRKSIGMNNTLVLLSYPTFPIVAMIVHILTINEIEFVFISTTLAIVTCYGGIQAQQAKLLKEKELELTQARISTMLSQIQPHFLYNALTAIKELSTTDPDAAGAAIGEFARYLRGNLDSLVQKKPIPFERELEHVETYLSLEKKRFDYKLNVDYDIAARNFMLPALSLQPIVENAVRHGITKRSKGGTVSIKTEETDKSFLITVKDDGVGFSVSALENEESSRIGIMNARSRLESVCNGSLDVQSEPGVGTTAVITIPKG